MSSFSQHYRLASAPRRAAKFKPCPGALHQRTSVREASDQSERSLFDGHPTAPGDIASDVVFVMLKLRNMYSESTRCIDIRESAGRKLEGKKWGFLKFRLIRLQNFCHIDRSETDYVEIINSMHFRKSPLVKFVQMKCKNSVKIGIF